MAATDLVTETQTDALVTAVAGAVNERIKGIGNVLAVHEYAASLPGTTTPGHIYLVEPTTVAPGEVTFPLDQTISDPSTEQFATVTIQDDGSSTTGWPDRFQVVFDPVTGTTHPTFWLNEYGEYRGIPAKSNTVGGRFFVAVDATDYAARSGSVPVFEVTDQRDGTRTTEFAVLKGGRVMLLGDLELGGDIIGPISGGSATLGERIATISNFASPNAGGYVVGRPYDNAFQGTAASTLAGAANRMDLAPYYTNTRITIDQIGVAVSTAVASALAKVVIYATGTDGWPSDLLYESGNLDVGVVGYRAASLSFTFEPGVQYWLGVRHSSTATLRTINSSSAVNLGLTTSTATSYAAILRKTVTFASAAPDPYTFASGDLVAATPPSIRFTVASIG